MMMKPLEKSLVPGNLLINYKFRAFMLNEMGRKKNGLPFIIIMISQYKQFNVEFRGMSSKNGISHFASVILKNEKKNKNSNYH